MPRGGYQKPSHPAPASGPGRLSRRTDGGPAQPIVELPDAQYGEAKNFRELQQGSPVASATATAGSAAPAAAPPTPIPLDAASDRGDEPVTSGADMGAGAGPEALGIGYEAETNADLAKLRGWLPVLMTLAESPEANTATRNFVRRLKAMAL